LTAKGRHRLLPVMSLWFRSLLPLAAVLISSCGSNGWHVLGSSPANDWRSAVAAQTAQLGSRNWIVITEASFPAQSRIGVKQIVANEEIPVVVDEVLRTLEQTEHVRPKVYLNREMRSVENDYAPGIDDFRQKLYVALRGIGPGRTVTYGELAQQLGLTGWEGARDVGEAMGKNPMPIVIPCHRVLAAGGKLGGFSAPGGSETKKKMLEMEGVQVGVPKPAQQSLGF